MRKWTCFSLTVMFYLLGNSDLVAVAGTKERAIANDDPLNRQNLDISSIKNKNNANKFVVFPVGINVGQSTLDFNPLIRGLENGAKAVKFKDWLIPFDVVTQALQFQVTNLANGQLELRSPGLVTRIDPQELTTDSELGLVISPQEIETIFGVPSKFDLIEYAIVFNPPWLGVEAKQEHTEETPPDLTGLPRIDAPRLTLTNVAQDLNISGNSGSSGNSRYQGNFKALGTAFDSSWFIRVNQPDLTKFGNWQLQEAQFLRQGKQTDYVLGSQSSFWPSDTNNQLWGITALKRWGFSPPPVSGGVLLMLIKDCKPIN